LSERRITSVPRPLLALLGVALGLQLLWHGLRPGPQADPRALPPPPSAHALRLVSLGEPLVLAKLLMLWLQAFDNQPGVSIPFRALDYARIEARLGRLLELDPRAQYPLLSASRVYALVPDEDKQRRMLEFVYRQFLADPNHRWRWLADAALVAKHRLRDLPLALKYARAITERATGPEVPFWARDLTLLVLEDMGEREAARVLVGGLLASGMIHDPSELRFLEQKLDALGSAGDDENSTPRRNGDSGR
jgi:hypothetical protein